MATPSPPLVRKLDGTLAPFDASKILARAHRLASGLSISIDRLTAKVVEQVHEDISTTALDTHLATAARQLALEHPDYAIFAGRVLSSRHEKGCPPSFSATIAALPHRLTPALVSFVAAHAAPLDEMVASLRDTTYALLDATSFDTLFASYFLKGPPPASRPLETFQTMMARVATALFFKREEPLPLIRKAFAHLVAGDYVHATPTLFNAGTNMGQLASCFLLPVDHDSINGILAAQATVTQMSKHSGGVGFDCSALRAAGSPIAIGGEATGVPGALKPFDANVTYCDQGRKRPGAATAYLHLAHADAPAFMRVQHPMVKAVRQIYPALWVPLLFHERCREGGPWSFFCPSVAPELFDGRSGPAFNALYTRLEREGRFVSQVSARDLLAKIVHTQLESGYPFVCNADLVNRCNNQRAVGPVRNSNLCTEIMQPALPPTEPGGSSTPTMCNLASLNLPRFLRDTPAGPAFDFERFGATVEFVVEALDAVIEETRIFDERMGNHNKAWRPMGIGVQGFADVLAALSIPWTSREARIFTANLFSQLYWSAVSSSAALATRLGPHAHFASTDIARGVFHPDHFDLSLVPTPSHPPIATISEIRARARLGMRNSFLIAPMPTASTSVILNGSPALEPWLANAYRHDTLVGTKLVLNRALVERLIGLGRWDETTQSLLMASQGSVGAIPNLPPDVYAVFATAFEMGDAVRRLAADAAPWIDQARSTNVHLPAGKAGVTEGVRQFTVYFPLLKTWVYYTKAKEAAAVTALNTASPSASSPSPAPSPPPTEGATCTRPGAPDCESCSA